jgi:hypothetical protein
LTRIGSLPPRSIVAFFPSKTSVPSVFVALAAQLVASVSSIRLPATPPSAVVAVAPFVADAQFIGKTISIVSFSPKRNRWRKRTWPCPGAWATNSYCPGAKRAVSSKFTTVAGVPAAGVAGFVSAIGEIRAS